MRELIEQIKKAKKLVVERVEETVKDILPGSDIKVVVEDNLIDRTLLITKKETQEKDVVFTELNLSTKLKKSENGDEFADRIMQTISYKQIGDEKTKTSIPIYTTTSVDFLVYLFQILEADYQAVDDAKREAEVPVAEPEPEVM